MKPFRRVKGVVAPLPRDNVDTDAIIPSREMKRVSRDGLGEGLFAAWRYQDVATRHANPDFVLNQPRYAGASILLGGENFGCGSSREHAVWALQEFGFRAVIAPSFGAIFERNCFNNGVLPLRLDGERIEQIRSACAGNPQKEPLTIDLEKEQIQLPDGACLAFETPGVQREMLLNGWDPIDRTLQLAEAISAFEAKDRKERPWVYAPTDACAKDDGPAHGL